MGKREERCYELRHQQKKKEKDRRRQWEEVQKRKKNDHWYESSHILATAAATTKCDAIPRNSVAYGLSVLFCSFIFSLVYSCFVLVVFGVSFISLLCIRIVFVFKFLIVSVTKWIVFYDKFKSNVRIMKKTYAEMHIQQEEKSKKILNFYWHTFFFCLFLTESIIIMVIRYSFREQCTAIVKLHASFICTSPLPSPPSSSTFFLLHSASFTSFQNSIFLISKFQSSLFICKIFDTCCHSVNSLRTKYFDCLMILFFFR